MTTVRKQIRSWWRDAIEGRESVNLRTLSSVAEEELRNNPEFCEQFFAEILRPMVYEVGMALLSGDRHLTLVRHNREQLAQAIEGHSSDWSRWLEYDPLSKSHIVLLSMRKDQALAAAKAREDRADPDLRRAALLRLAAGRLKEGQKISDRWTEEQLAEMEVKIEIGRPTYSLGKGTILELMKGVS